MQELDYEVGRVLQKLDELGLANNTLVIFGSDNGAPVTPGPSNAPLREGKWTNFEGGIRTPCLMRWPGRIRAGATSDAIAGIWDLLPTFCAVAEATPPADRTLDGRQTASLLGFQPHDIPVLVGVRLLQPLGKPVPNAPKYFATCVVEQLRSDPEWLDKASRAISRH